MTILTPQAFVARCGATSVDRLFTRTRHQTDFVFSDDVSDVFPDMIGRSVPGYWTNVDWIGHLAQSFIEDDDVIYDLGCSLGAVGWSIDRQLKVPATLIAVDNSAPMMSRLALNLKGLGTQAQWILKTADVTTLQLEPCKVVTMHYCLQFIPIHLRAELLTRIYDALKPDGALFLSEKIRGETNTQNEWLRSEHHRFKQRQGYSEEEIVGKANSIATMMPVESIQTHEDRLRSAGFSQVIPWRRELNFNSWVAIK